MWAVGAHLVSASFNSLRRVWKSSSNFFCSFLLSALQSESVEDPG